MKIQDLLKRLGIPASKERRWLERAERQNVRINGEDIDDRVAVKILVAASNYVELRRYMGERLAHYENLPCVQERIIRDFSSYLRVIAPEWIVPARATLFCTTPNAWLLLKEKLPVIDRWLDEYITWRRNHVGANVIELITEKKASEGNKAPINVKKLRTAAGELGIKMSVLKNRIECGVIPAGKDGIAQSTIDEIISQREVYVDIADIIKIIGDTKFTWKDAKNRENLRILLERENFFGLPVLMAADCMFDIPGPDTFYLRKKDVPIFLNKTNRYFSEFGLSEIEKIENLKDNCLCISNREWIERWYKVRQEGKPVTSTMTEMIRAVMQLKKPVTDLKTKEIANLTQELELQGSIELLKDFCDYVRNNTDVNYAPWTIKENSSAEGVKAYRQDSVDGLAYCIFNREYIQTNGLIVKAFNKSIYVEMWLYLSAHFVTLWRAGDICAAWPYFNFTSLPDVFPDIVRTSNAEQLKKCILAADEELLQKVGHVIAVDAYTKAKEAHKTALYAPNLLRIAISPALEPHFGLLALICEYHHIKDGTGRLDIKRYSYYGNRVYMAEFFGREIMEPLDGMNFSSRKMNHAVSQALESAARDRGASGIMAHTIAGYARSHRGSDSMQHYLRDHTYDGESPEVILQLMMQRGVLSVAPYKLLCAAYPDVFERLDTESQTRLIEMTGLTGYEVEMISVLQNTGQDLLAALSSGNQEQSIAIIEGLLKISQGLCGSKDDGCYCLLRALGFSCEHTTELSCIACGCQYNVLTSVGIPALIDCVKNYQIKSKIEPKYASILKRVVYPLYKKILDRLFNKMAKDEIKAFKQESEKYKEKIW